MAERLWLKRTHIGYYRIVQSILLSHIALAIDSLLPGRHDAPVYTYIRPLLVPYGIVHVLVAAALILGLLADERWWWIARWACFTSLLTFNTYAVGLLCGAFFHGGAFVGPVGLIALSVSSAASWREPTAGPPFRSLNTRAT